jgi:hypothetical protein
MVMQMTWKEIRSWAKSKGYNTKKIEEGYSWELIDNNTINGISKSVSKLARDIFNHITANKFVDHQQNYIKDITYEYKKDFWGFTNNKDFRYIKITVKSLALFNNLKYYSILSHVFCFGNCYISNG